MKLLDGLVNLVSGLGTSRDKGYAATYQFEFLDDYQAQTAYLSSALVRRAVDLPAEDSCREWREWQAEAAEISAIEKVEQRLGVQSKVLEARRMARLYGGAALYLGTNDPDPMKPLDVSRLGKDGIKYLLLLTKSDISPNDTDTDPMSMTFRKPRRWSIRGTDVHPSRVAIFRGLRQLEPEYDGWGFSALNGMLDSIKRIDEGAANILSLVYEAKIDVISIPNLMANMQSRGSQYTTDLLRRLQLAMTAKGMNGALILDSQEEYSQKSASFSALPEVLDRFMQLASATSGIPMTLLFGMSPAGMNATGESDIRAYYDRIRVEQTLFMTPEMTNLDEGIIWSALGARPEEIHYNWRALWQPTAEQKAATGEKLVNSLSKLHSMAVIPGEAIGETAVNVLTETGVFPGLESSVETFYEENPDYDPAEEGAPEDPKIKEGEDPEDQP